MKKTVFLISCLFVFAILLNCRVPLYAYVGSHKGVLECSNCHITGYDSAEGNVNLCLSCHTGGATASNFAFYSIDQASITASGVYGKSHGWDAIAYQATSNPTGNYSMDIATDPATIVPASGTMKDRDSSTADDSYRAYDYAKVFIDSKSIYRITCSSCHNAKTASFIRNEKERDTKLCADCHTYDFQMSTATAMTYNAKKMNHPVKNVGNSYVGCSSCHVIHSK